MSSHVDIEIPYGLTFDELVLETVDFDPTDIVSFLRSADTDELERIMRAAVVVKSANPDTSIQACIATAVVWERG